MPLYLKEAIQEYLKDGVYTYATRGDDLFLMTYYANPHMFEKKPKVLLRNYEREYGHPLFVRYNDKALAYLLKFVSLRFKTHFSNVSFPIIPLTISSRDICLFSPGLLDNNPEQIRNKLKISAYVLETT